MLVKLKKCHPSAKILDQKDGNVGFDIYTVEDIELKPNGVTKVRTGLAIADYNSDYYTWPGHRVQVPPKEASKPLGFFRKLGIALGFIEDLEFEPIAYLTPNVLTVYPKIEGRSGLASQGIFPVGNIIDPNYRGEMCVTMANMNAEPYQVRAGDRIAQFVFYTCLTIPDIKFEETDVVVETDRGSKGFGSSGR